MANIELKFDEKEVDTSQAEKYLRASSNHEFRPSKGDLGEIVTDTYGNKIYLNKSQLDLINVDWSWREKSSVDNTVKFFRLSQKIEANADLFCQLEYVIRNIPMENVKNFDIKLLVQNFLYYSSKHDEIKPNYQFIAMTSDTPLAMLGCVAHTACASVVIKCSPQTAVVTSLFISLCKEVGLDWVSSYHITEPINNKPTIVSQFTMKGIRTGCIGIVTERSDIDSAVDTFLSATNKGPWNIKTIFVQESAIERFKKSLEWKTKLESNQNNEYLKSCTCVYVCEDKMFLFEYVGNTETVGNNTIVIELYRTNKELLEIMAKINPFCVSLWSSNIAEANQITYGINTNIIWINDYGNFDGPPQSSQAFYSKIRTYCIMDTIKQFPYCTYSNEIEKAVRLRDGWIKLEESERLIKIMEAFDTFNSSSDKKMLIDVKLTPNSTVDLKKSVITYNNPVDLAVIDYINTRDISNDLNFIIRGGAVLFLEHSEDLSEEMSQLCKILQSISAPVAVCYSLKCPTNFDHLTYNTKAIWTSTGSSFAN